MDRASPPSHPLLLVDDRPAEGVFRVHRSVYTDPELFDLEQKYLFERTWIWLALESQVAQPNDFITTWIGRYPVLVSRDAAGRIGAFLNTCRHKGAVVCRSESGNRKVHVCPYHGWCYGSDGKNVGIKNRNEGAYSEAFERDDHGLVPLPRLASYKGLVFGSLCREVPPLEDYLGEMKFLLDCAMEQGPRGMEFVPGRAIFTYRGNWKLQWENGIDFYHLTSTHASFMEVMARRTGGELGNQQARQFDWARRLSQQGGMFAFAHGHAAIWLDQAEAEKRPIYPALPEIRERVGPMIADWMLKVRNVAVFPNMQVSDSTSLNIRQFRPLAADRTELRYYCLAPIGEDPARRAWRLRQFEDFFMASGLATSDDATVYELCQEGAAARDAGWLQGYARGMTAQVEGADATARAIGIRPTASLTGAYLVQNETCFHPLWREWDRLMRAGMSGGLR